VVEILYLAEGPAMSRLPAYTEYHPRWYRRRVSTYWWMGRGSYFAFILRELSSLSVVWFVIFTLMQVYALGHDPADYSQFRSFSRHPVVIVVNLIALFFIIFHAVTWFNLAPKAMVVRYQGKRVPSLWIALPNYVAWAVVSALVAWIILR
jgi:fumarate reductase subunit C